jgi:hypothetical protein
VGGARVSVRLCTVIRSLTTETFELRDVRSINCLTITEITLKIILH